MAGAPPAVDLASAPSWRRDPFLFGDETRDAARPVLQTRAPVPPIVRTILYSASRRLAIVDGRIVEEGPSGRVLADPLVGLSTRKS